MLEKKLIVPEPVSFQRVEGEIIILDLRLGKYYGLNATASDLWEKLASGETLGEAVNFVVDKYRRPRHKVEVEASGLADRWLRHGLLHEEVAAPL